MQVTGSEAEKALGRANITCNKNSIPNDPQKPMITSGIRLGSPAATTRGFGTEEFQKVGQLILQVLEGLSNNGAENNQEIEQSVKTEVIELCKGFPIY